MISPLMTINHRISKKMDTELILKRKERKNVKSTDQRDKRLCQGSSAELEDLRRWLHRELGSFHHHLVLPSILQPSPYNNQIYCTIA